MSVDHIVPFRLVKENLLLNLISLCRDCHAVKTAIEARLLGGDILGFLAELRIRQWPMDRVEAALRHYKLLAPHADNQEGKAVEREQGSL